MNANKQFEFLDVLTIMSFAMQVENYGENVTQGDVQELMQSALADIHKHLKTQDEKLNLILEVLGYDENKKVSRRNDG